MVFNFFNLQEVKEIFEAFDKDGSKQLDFDEFLIALRVSIESVSLNLFTLPSPMTGKLMYVHVCIYFAKKYKLTK